MALNVSKIRIFPLLTLTASFIKLSENWCLKYRLRSNCVSSISIKHKR